MVSYIDEPHLLRKCTDHRQKHSEPIRHSPVWCPHKRVGRRNNGRRTKVPKFDLSRLSQQDVTCFHIPAEKVNLHHQSSESTLLTSDEVKMVSVADSA